MQLLKVAGTEGQYVVEFKNKDYGSQLLFYDMLDFMRGDLAQKSGLAKLASEQQEQAAWDDITYAIESIIQTKLWVWELIPLLI